MVDPKNVQEQLKKLKFGATLWNQAELRELPHILHEHEEMVECVNGLYEGGVALLIATNSRLLLVDKKPLNYLNVEDLRFDMINEIDYSHRLFGASIIISTGSKTLNFKSYNQGRLRNLINLVQERMSLIKKEQNDKADNQQQHLEEINKQLQMYLLAQHQQLQTHIEEKKIDASLPRPNAELSDYLFAQRLLEDFQKQNGTQPVAQAATAQAAFTAVTPELEPAPISQAELVADAKQEVFNKQLSTQASDADTSFARGLEINPLSIAYSKLPMVLRNRRFGRPSLRAATQQTKLPTSQGAPS